MVSTGDFLGPICPDEFDSNDLYEQFLNIKVGETDAFTLTDADGNSARYVKDPFPEYRWCKGCKEHDREKHCCHRFSTVIREAVDELNKSSGITSCIRCGHFDTEKCYCDKWKQYVPDYGGGCTWGKPRDNGGSE